jgi:L-serine dehydratase
MNVNRFRELIDICERTGEPLDKVVLHWEMLDSGLSPEKVLSKTEFLFKVMEESYEKNRGKVLKTLVGLTGENAKKMESYIPFAFTGEKVFQAAAIAVTIAESNASMKKIVACPTGGASGVVPGVLLTLKKYGVKKEKLVSSLVIAGAIGKVISLHASLSGAQHGCQAEIGSGTAMAAGAAVYAMDGTPKQVADAAALSLKSLMGLVCDPVGGFVEVPCVKRNASGAVLALLFADMARAGVESVVPFDEVVDAMAKVGRMMPEALRETGKGGIADTPTAKSIMDAFSKKFKI